MPEPAAPCRSTAVPAVCVSMLSVTARPPPLVSLAVVVPGPASSNGNLNFNVCACAVLRPAAAPIQISDASVMNVFQGDGFFLFEGDNIGGVGCFCCS